MRPPVEVSTAPAVMPLPAAFAAAAAGGAVLDGAFPDKNWWPLAFLGIGLILAALPGRRAGAAFSVGLVAGVSFYGFHIQWVALFLGPVPITALVLLQALLFAAGCTAITLAYRWLPQLWPGPWGACLGVPAVVAAVWCAREEVSSTWPYGGFSWGRAAMSQSTSPLRESFAWLGISGVGFVMVLVVAMILQIVSTRTLRHPGQWIAPVAAAAMLVGLPAWPLAQTGTMRVGAVQGNGPAGYFDDSNPGDLTQAQVDATTPLLDERLDAVLWPEGATDRSPLDDNDTAATFDAIAQATAAPLIGWAITERDGKTYNTEIQWEPGAGPVDFYDKKHPVPFGEYVPDRAFWRSLAPDLVDMVDMVARDYTPGTTDPIFHISGVPVGISICFDIVDDDVLRQSVTEGAQVLFSSSNNADFGRSDQSAQQLAIAQIRAIELGRSVVNISTVGRSAVIAPDGSISKELPWHAPGALIADVPLANSVTPAARWGGEIETALAVLGFGSLIGAFLVLHRPRLTSRSCHRNVP